MAKILLTTEGGVTRISLDNAKQLIAEYGLPDKVELFQSGQELLVEATWNTGMTHIFSGFSWGYGGEGPHGLFKFFEMLRMRILISMKTIAGFPQENFPSLTYVKGEDYD